MDPIAQNLYISNMVNTTQAPIPNYNLFGESQELPDVVHCETIEARSQLHDWEFTPHRHARLHQILLVEQGGGVATLDGRSLPLQPMTAANIPKGIVHGYRFATGTRGMVITMATELLDQVLYPGEGVAQILARPALITASDSIRLTMTDLYNSHDSRSFGRAHILRALSALLLGQIARTLSDANPSSASASSHIVEDFEALIDSHFRAHWPVSRYAAELSVTPTHLSRLTRAATGRPATGLIQDRLIREARRNLVYTNMTVQTIAYELGYDDPAYFSRVFSRATGLSPRAFRDQAQS